MKKFPILLTATIKPHISDGIYKIQQSEEERYNDYKNTLNFIARSGLFSKIVFSDNSSSSLLPSMRYHARILSKRGINIEVINSPIKNELEVTGKGYGEGYSISKAIEKTEALNSTDSFFKLTGRYKVHNLYRIIPSIHKALIDKPELKFICSNFKIYNNEIYTVSTAFFWTDSIFWKRYFMNCYNDVDDKNGLAYEAIIGSKFINLIKKNFTIGELMLPLIIEAKNTKNNKLFVRSKTILFQIFKSYIAHYIRPLKSIRILSSEINTNEKRRN